MVFYCTSFIIICSWAKCGYLSDSQKIQSEQLLIHSGPRHALNNCNAHIFYQFLRESLMNSLVVSLLFAYWLHWSQIGNGFSKCVAWLTDCVSWALVQHIKNFSLLLQLLACPSSSLCLTTRKKRQRRNKFVWKTKQKNKLWGLSQNKKPQKINLRTG